MQKPNLNKIPHQPGVYSLKLKNKPLYIGKAADLRNRVSSYFKKQKDQKINSLVAEAQKIEWETTDSEIEALILEFQLIKKIRPKYNIKLRDDKQYFYVGFTRDTFPKVFITHQPLIQPSTSDIRRPTSFIGPFTDGDALKTTLRLLRKIFPYCTCRQKHNVYCLNYHINKCLGYCCIKNIEYRARSIKHGALNLEREYKNNIKRIKTILSGKKASVIKDLNKKMRAEARKENFQAAIKLRNEIAKLEKVFKNARIISQLTEKTKILNQLREFLELPTTPYQIEAYDISNIQGKFAAGAMAVFTDSTPDKSQYRKFKIRTIKKPDDVAMLKEMLSRRIKHRQWPLPDLVLIDGGRAQFNAARDIIAEFTQGSAKKISAIALAKDEKHQPIKLFFSSKKPPALLKTLPDQVRNLLIYLDSEAHRFAIQYYRKLHKKVLV